MNDGAYIVYKGLKTLIKNAENCHNEHDFDQRELMEGWKDSVEILESSSFDFKARYDREMTVINSFTREQIDHICYQIGDWYLMMKPLLEGQHNLGYMKEKLKTMICGE